MKKQKLLPPPSEKMKLTMAAFDNDPELMILYEEWIKCGMKAGKAYKNLHPEVTDLSANVLAWRALKKVNKEVLMQAYALDIDSYMTQLKEGMAAEKKAVLRKYDKLGNLVQELDLSGPDHKVRDSYHDKLGMHLGIQDKKGEGNTTEVKVLVVPSEGLAEKYAIQVSSNTGNSSQG